MLILAAPTVMLSFLLNLDGPTNVVIPWIDMTLPPTCSMQSTMGIDCPGCGLTRSFISLAHGDMAASIAFNPTGILLFGITVFQIPYRVLQLRRIRLGKPEWDLSRPATGVWIVVVIVMVVQWIPKIANHFGN